MKDPFSYEARWGSLGLDCSYCSFFVAPKSWPDDERAVSCSFHQKRLSIQLSDSGYKEGEWFCRSFSNSGQAHPKSLAEFKAALPNLESGVLYKTNGPGTELSEVRLEEFQDAI